MADVEVAPERVVEKHAERDAFAHHDVERHRDVDRVGAGVVSERVAVPHRQAVAAELPAALVKRSVLLAEAVDVLVVAESLPDANGCTGESGPALRVVLIERLTGARSEGNAERRMLDRDAKGARGDHRAGELDRERRAGIAEIAIDD